jgi:hypothetical protein
MYGADINPGGNNFSVVLDTGRHALLSLTPFPSPPTQYPSRNISHLFLMSNEKFLNVKPRWPTASSSAYYPAPPASPQNQNEALRNDYTHIDRPIVQAFAPHFHRPVPICDVPLPGGDDHPFHPAGSPTNGTVPCCLPTLNTGRGKCVCRVCILPQ